MAARDPEAPRYGQKDANEYARSSSHCGTHYAAGDPLRTDLSVEHAVVLVAVAAAATVVAVVAFDGRDVGVST
jgi:hypothetical protein